MQIEENEATIETGALPTVEGDRTQLEQLFSNLVCNAIKYHGDEPPSVEIDATERGAYWEISVADNGIGIDPEFTDQIFDVFNRLHTDAEYPGTGIGLALCRKIVRAPVAVQIEPLAYLRDVGADRDFGGGVDRDDRVDQRRRSDHRQLGVADVRREVLE